MSPDAITVEKIGSKDYGPCACCGSNSRTVWGSLSAGGRTVAVYYVQWTLGRVRKHGAHFDLVIGEWGQDSSRQQRQDVAAAYRLDDNGPAFMIIDAASPTPAKDGALAATALRRDQVIGSPLAATVFGFIDAIWSGDERIRELVGGAA